MDSCVLSGQIPDESNLPSGQCVICLYDFTEGDVFIKTQCYHYFHSHCLASHLIAGRKYYQEELEKLPNWQQMQAPPYQQTCPVCRCALTCDVDTLKKAPAPVESITAPPFRLTAELKALQLKMAALLSQQVAKGGVVAVGDTGPPPLTITSPADNENVYIRVNNFKNQILNQNKGRHYMNIRHDRSLVPVHFEAHPLGDSIEAFEHQAEFFHPLCHEHDIVGKPKVLMPSPFHCRSLKASSKAAVNSFGDMTSPCLKPLFKELPSNSVPVLGPKKWRFYTNTTTFRYTDSQYDIAGETLAPPRFNQIKDFLPLHIGDTSSSSSLAYSSLLLDIGLLHGAPQHCLQPLASIRRQRSSKGHPSTVPQDALHYVFPSMVSSAPPFIGPATYVASQTPLQRTNSLSNVDTPVLNIDDAEESSIGSASAWPDAKPELGNGHKRQCVARRAWFAPARTRTLQRLQPPGKPGRRRARRVRGDPRRRAPRRRRLAGTPRPRPAPAPAPAPAPTM
ncbi:hypothetical protein MSG28_009611 [Choristoneura fumiferana]|uniref:Uncharacterized protein n=1 Tax=Choristoneura fumiferana TaxID=7141 RepID=A0ACC0JBS9_CHOFU|nr:hypothetical protein MSG28_009611 [Choristoneura fumiferana]